ncbi:MAG: monofunctional biosynthetic peptidoglycan transglycosylase [Elusimicrobia bacterium]|nr:monofunctional biosynthetic peptidoglycan transglycosylase [Elusimicrobiota bacterium]
MKLIPVFSTACFASLFGCLGYLACLPDVSSLKRHNPKETQLMILRETQAEKAGKKSTIIQQWMPYEKISPHLRNAVIVAEDGRYWEHNGFDVDQFREAMRRNWEKKRLHYGASTITQQLAKNLYLSPSKNPLRKAKEAVITRQMEKHLTKRRILEIYLNVAEWGPGIYGAEAAAHHYFGKSANDLTPEEAATLAAYLPAPLRYPKPRNAKYVSRMAKRILIRMRARGYLSDPIGA